MTAIAEAPLRPIDLATDLPGVAELIGAANEHAGAQWYPSVAQLAIDWAASPTHDPAGDTRIVEADGRIVGLVRTSWREREGGVIHRVDVWVHPDVQRRGLGRRLLDWGEARARVVAAAATGPAAELEHRLGGVTNREDAAGVALAVGAGYTPSRFHYEMHRNLAAPIPEIPMPDGLEVRPVRPEHHRAVWEADVEAFRDHWDAATNYEEDFERFFAHPDLDTSLWQVAWAGDEIAGVVINGIYPEESARIGLDIGWLDGVSTRRPWRKRGLASALIARSLVVLRERGMAVAALGVDTESPTGALGLYERFGFAPVRTWAFYRKPL